MILDKNAQLVTATAFDLGTGGLGKGTPIKMIVTGMNAGNLAITHADTAGGTYSACTTVTVQNNGDLVEFELPSNTKQFIRATFATGEVYVTFAGNQTQA